MALQLKVGAKTIETVPAVKNLECTHRLVLGDQSVRFEIVVEGSNKRRRKLVSSDGFAYTVKTVTNRTWRFSIRNKTIWCRATVLQRGDSFIPGSCDHVHAPDNLIVNRVKDSALADIHRSAGSIAEAVLSEQLDHNYFNLPRPDYLARAANRLHQNLRPRDPKDLDFEIDHGFLRCPELIIGDVHVDNQRHILFATEQQLSLLRQSRRWYLDGTFEVRKDPFKQPCSVHAFLQKDDSCKQVPLAFTLMSSRRTQDYEAVFRKLKECLGGQPAVQGFVMDFESACWPVVMTVFTGAELKECSFHWAQAVLRKVGSLGLRPTYDQRQGWHHRLNGIAVQANLPFYILVPLLLNETGVRVFTTEEAPEDDLPPNPGKVAELWDQYDQDAISTSAFLKRVGHVYAPRATADQQFYMYSFYGFGHLWFCNLKHCIKYGPFFYNEISEITSAD
ncbi:uncharacterized protein LOC110456619 [Mizuhopecten yessoensis]|uniref:uncharacterized protein LOC110456619 n=1 Tax=Mizuhopecten yessoensis TaxID=6573 RepID=UPI000B457E38|nr:uncharacterized protein LOC110456619 [Mizuhopecten yessoensis]